MSIEKNKALTRRSFEEIYNKGNFDVAYKVYSENFLNLDHEDGNKGQESIKIIASKLRKSFPDLRFEIVDQIAEGDMVATRWTFNGTHKGNYRGIAPTGKVVNSTGITIHRMADGKIVESWVNNDEMGLMQQLWLSEYNRK